MFKIKQELRYDQQALLGQIVIFRMSSNEKEEVGFIAKATDTEITILCRREVDTGVFEVQAVAEDGVAEHPGVYCVVDTLHVSVDHIRHEINRNLDDEEAIQLRVAPQMQVVELYPQFSPGLDN